MNTATTATRMTTLLQTALIALLYLGSGCAPAAEHDESGHGDHEEGGHEEEHGDDDGHGDGHGAEDEHGDEHEGEGEHVEGRVELTAEQVAAAGIEVEVAGPLELHDSLTLPAVVSMNGDASTHVNPKVPGLVRTIYMHLGDRVETGDLLCTIDSVELGSTVADLVLAQALVEAAEETLTKEQALFTQRLATAEELLSGAVEVNQAIYAREQELQERAVSTIRPLLEAEKELKNSKLAKAQRLSDLEAERDTRLLQLDVQRREKRILAEGARNRLLALGIEARLLEDVDASSPLLAGTYDIRATRPGIVAERHLSIGEYVGTATRLFTIGDLSSVWVIASVFEQQLSSVRTGQQAEVTLNSFPGRSFPATVAVVGYEADPETRAIGVRLELPNPVIEDWPEEYPFRPGMFASVQLATSTRSVRLAIPESAVVHGNDGDSVFVLLEPGVFQQRPITVSTGIGVMVEVLSGLEPGVEIAVSGTFLLRSVAGQEELGGGHSH